MLVGMVEKIKLIFLPFVVAIIIAVMVIFIQEQFPIQQQIKPLKVFEYTAVHFSSGSEMPNMPMKEEMREDSIQMNMTHRFEIAGELNPTIKVKLCDFVKIKFTNTDEIMLHDLTLPKIGLKTEILKPNEYDEIEFIADSEGQLEYLCTLHPDDMKGKILISS